MNIEQVKNYYESKKDIPCPLTEKLIKAGYQQNSGGYIDYAKKVGVTVDYKQALPTQHWHLIKAFCQHKSPNASFNKQIVCGELIFWMAEVAECVETEKLEKLMNDILTSKEFVDFNHGEKPNNCRRGYWNKKIQKLCFVEIRETVEKFHKDAWRNQNE